MTKLDLGRLFEWVVTRRADRCVPDVPWRRPAYVWWRAWVRVRIVSGFVHKEIQLFQLPAFLQAPGFRQFPYADDWLGEGEM